MENKELEAISLGKKVDRIILVTDDLYTFVRDMTHYFEMDNWTLSSFTCATGAVCRQAILPLTGGMEIQAVEPLSEDSIYGSHLRRFGKGILGLREVISPADWDARLDYSAKQGLRLIPGDEDDIVWLDAADKLGGMICLRRDDGRTLPEGKDTLCQICIVTDDILRTSHDMCELLQVGPWEIGKANNDTFKDLACGGYAAGHMPESHFRVGIGMYGALQFEIIEPQSGPLPYFGFLNRRGLGFHHIKFMLPSRYDYEQSMKEVRKKGIRPALSGRITDCPWCNWATEDLFGFVLEQNDPTELTALPDGYDPYFVQ